MSDSNRLLIAAAAIGLIVSSIVWSVLGVGLLTSSPERAANNGYVQAERSDRYYESRNAILALTHEACAQASETADDDAQRGNTNKRDLCAQYVAASAARRAAAFSEIQTWIGFLGFGFVIVGLVLNWIATKAATEQTNIARLQLQTVNRPELFASVQGDVRETLAYTNPYALVTVSITNAGERSAIFQKVYLKLHVSAYPPTPETILTEAPHVEGRTLLGTDKTTESMIAGRPGENALRKLLDDEQSIYVLGYIPYSDRLGAEWEMGFCFRWWISKIGLENAPQGWEPFGGPSHNFDRPRAPKN